MAALNEEEYYEVDDFEEDSELQADPETAWLEELTIGDFRVWHILVFCFATLLAIIIMLCCCMKFRIPRTKQEIEADYQRKQIAKKFREKLSNIKNSEMDEMDLPKALVKIQAEFLSEENSTESQKDSQENSMQGITNRANAHLLQQAMKDFGKWLRGK